MAEAVADRPFDLRADHVGVYGHDGIDTPNLDALADGGARFDRAYTPCPTTLAAHVSILTGATGSAPTGSW